MKKTNILPDWAAVLRTFRPGDAREETEQRVMLSLLEREGDGLLSRENGFAHFTASAVIVNPSRDRTLMAFHKIYRSWAWPGGHADGERCPEAVARREAQEETGITGLERLGGGAMSLEILPVWAHVRRGETVASHLHLNVSYLFLADDTVPLCTAPEENSAVAWLPVDALGEYVSEPDMMPIYRRLLQRANNC